MYSNFCKLRMKLYAQEKEYENKTALKLHILIKPKEFGRTWGRKRRINLNLFVFIKSALAKRGSFINFGVLILVSEGTHNIRT